MQMAFLEAITSASRVSEFQVLLTGSPFMVFHKDMVPLRHKFRDWPKVVSVFYLNQTINIPVFFLKPHSSKAEKTLHTLGVCEAQAFWTAKNTSRPLASCSLCCEN